MTTDNREAFEAWAVDARPQMNLIWAKGGYVYAEAVSAFAAYRAALSTHKEAGEPVMWQWRKKSTPWTLEKTFNSQVYATTKDSEVRALYTKPQPQESVLSSPVASVGSAKDNECANSRGSDAQILKERELTASAIMGAIMMGYQNGTYPPDDSAWLRGFYDIGRRSRPADPCTALASAGQDEKSPVSQVPQGGQKFLRRSSDALEMLARANLTQYMGSLLVEKLDQVRADLHTLLATTKGE